MRTMGGRTNRGLGVLLLRNVAVVKLKFGQNFMQK